MNNIENNSVEELFNGIAEEAVTQNEQFEIPMDAPIIDFGFHLQSHPRTILSAKFGDGKTFFLSKFEEMMKDDCLIITLHPVNYQIVENKDIFELIKRDILFQITLKGMLNEDLNISETAAWMFYVQNSFMGFSESIISFLSLLQSPSETVNGVLTALKTHKIFKELRKKVSNVKRKYESTDALEDFINECKNICVLEEDVVTTIIYKSIDQYKKRNPKKRVILVIEDMDRLDPAHLFRIMNVFSAHLDTNEKYFFKSNGSYFYNKFHFDNVVFVMDFDNTRNIFRHFYGADTNFEGYIEKFVTKRIFKYSLEVEKYYYLIDRVTSIVFLPKEYVQAVLQPQYFEGKSLRSIVNSFEKVDDHIIKHPFFEKKYLHFGILRLYAIMNNLGVDGYELVNCYWNLLEEGIDVFPYFVGILYTYSKLLRVNRLLPKNHFICTGIKKDDKSVNDDNFTNTIYYDVEIHGYNENNNCLSYSINEGSSKYIFQTYKNISYSSLKNVVSRNKFEDFPNMLNTFVAK